MLAATEGARCPARPPAAARVPRVDRRVPAVVRAPRSSVPLRVRSRAVATTTRRRNVVLAASADESSRGDESKRRYVNFTGFPFPLVPFLSRRTVVNEVVKGAVWTLEQEQGIGFDLGVSTNVRCTIVKMRDGRLWVHDPIAPTGECVEAIEAIGGDVAYVVLATTQYEHKIFAGPFSRKFPDAEVWIAPGQFSFPLQLPPQFFGIFPTGTIADGGMPWESEIATKLLRLPSLFWGNYTYCEAAFYHKDSRSVFITDAAVYVRDEPPEVIPNKALVDLGAPDGFTISLLRALDFRGGRALPGADVTRADPDGCAKVGWKRMALFSLFIAPDAKNILKPDESFAGLAGKFVVSPIVYVIVFQHYREEVLTWVDAIGRDWGGADRVIGAHFPVCERDAIKRPGFIGGMFGAAMTNPFDSVRGGGGGGSSGGGTPVKRFTRAFAWAATAADAPAEYVDVDDLASLELVARFARFVRAVPRA